MPTFQASIALTITADNQAEADCIADGAAEHLISTFNDDGSLAQATPSQASAVTLAFELADQTCHDVICTACEGGINYWCDIVRKTRATRPGETVPDITSFEAQVQDGPVSCDHPEIEAQEIDVFTIDPGMIRDGLRRLLAPDANISPSIRNDAVLQLIDPEHACDADTADAIVQFAVFGELVFG